ncbi:MAG: YncE family protein [Steroidobacteraceae bacterium]
MAGSAIVPLEPKVTGTVTQYSVAPTLPAGLTLDPSSGQITGTPTVPTAATVYTITAANSAGSTSFGLSIACTPTLQTATSDSARASLNYYVLSFQANDLVWDAVNQRIYFAISANSTLMPNTIVAVDPTTGTVTSQLSVAQEPQRLSVSQDGRYLYVAMAAGGGVDRLNAPNLTLDIQIPVGDAATQFVQIAAAPNAAQTLAVASFETQLDTPAVAIYDDAVERPNPMTFTENFSGFTWDPSGSLIYAQGSSGLDEVAVAATGLSIAATLLQGDGDAPVYNDGRIYTMDGFVFDLASNLVVGRFGDYAGDAPRTQLLANKKTFGLHEHYKAGSQPPTVDGILAASFDTDTFTLIDTTVLLGTSASRMISWGGDGFAFVGDTAVIAWGSFAGTESVPTPAVPTSVSSGTLSSTLGQITYAVYDLGANNVVASPCTNQFFVATTGVAAEGVTPYAPNSVVAISPTGTVQTSVFAGSEPNVLALSNDCSLLYAGLLYSNSIQRINATTLTADILIPLQSSGAAIVAGALDVAPGMPRTMVVSPQLMGPYECDAPGPGYVDSIFDDATARPNVLSGVTDVSNDLVWGDTAATIYGEDLVDFVNGAVPLSAWAIDGNGFEASNPLLVPSPVGTDLHYDRVIGRLYDVWGNYTNVRSATPTPEKVAATWTNLADDCGAPLQAMTTDTNGAAFFAYPNEADAQNAYLDIAVYEPTALALTNHWELPQTLGYPSTNIAVLPNAVAVVMQSGQLVIFNGAVGFR